MVTNRFKQLRAGKDKVSASEYNRMGKVVHAVSRSLVSHGMMDNAGITIRRPPVGSAGAAIKVFIVQSAATGDGVYNCRESYLDATDWNDTGGNDRLGDLNAINIEVLNLFEANSEASYSNALGIYDAMYGWQWTDDEGTKRWVGVPITGASPTRMAITTQDAPSEVYIQANLVGQDGVEIASGLGAGISVYCSITPNIYSADTIKLDAATPLLKNDMFIPLINVNGIWWCTTVFEGSGAGGAVFKAFCKVDAGATTTIVCWKSETDNEAGTEVTVNFNIAGGGNCNEALPRLTDGTPIYIKKNAADAWECVQTLIGSENCNCS